MFVTGKMWKPRKREYTNNFVRPVTIVGVFVLGLSRCFDATCGYPGEGPSRTQLTEQETREIIATKFLDAKDAGQSVRLKLLCIQHNYNLDEAGVFIPVRSADKKRNPTYKKLENLVAEMKKKRKKEILEKENVAINQRCEQLKRQRFKATQRAETAKMQLQAKETVCK